jgi:hypothetical protein
MLEKHGQHGHLGLGLSKLQELEKCEERTNFIV